MAVVGPPAPSLAFTVCNDQHLAAQALRQLLGASFPPVMAAFDMVNPATRRPCNGRPLAQRRMDGASRTTLRSDPAAAPCTRVGPFERASADGLVPSRADHALIYLLSDLSRLLDNRFVAAAPGLKRSVCP